MENIYCYNNDKFEKFIKEKLNSEEYELIKKYSVNDITSETNDITKWLYKMFSENQLPKTDLKINNSWFYCEIFEVYNKFVKSKKIKHIRDYKKWDDFYNDILNLLDEKTNSEKDDEAKKGAILLANKDSYLLYEIKTWEAAIKYGKGTKWCVSSKITSKWFDMYTNEENKKLMYLIDKNSTKKYGIEFVYNKETNIPYVLLFNELNETISGYMPLFKIINNKKKKLKPNLFKNVISENNIELINWMFEELQKMF